MHSGLDISEKHVLIICTKAFAFNQQVFIVKYTLNFANKSKHVLLDAQRILGLSFLLNNNVVN